MNEDPFDISDWREATRRLLEKDVERPSVKKARRAGFWVRKFSSPANRAAPDDVFAKAGRVFWVEFKAPGKKPTELQELEHAKMRAAGLTVYVCDHPDKFDMLLANEERMLK